MFFVFSKLVFALIAPSNVCLLAIGAGLVLGGFKRWRAFGRRLAIGGFVLLVVFGFSPVGKFLTRPLEERFASVELPPAEAVTHILVLGGAEQARLGKARGRLSVNAAGERFVELPALARRFPSAKVLFSGGDATMVGDQVVAGVAIRRYLVSAGISPERILIEEQSRNTWENGLYSRELLAGGETKCPCGYLLVTSAWHMPRAMGVFRQLGFDSGEQRLYPWPVDFRTQGKAADWEPFNWLYDGLEQTDQATREWIGLFAYWVSGRTASLWPGPSDAQPDEQSSDKNVR